MRSGSDLVYDAAIRRAGMLRVDTLQQLFLAAETLTRLSMEAPAIVASTAASNVASTAESNMAPNVATNVASIRLSGHGADTAAVHTLVQQVLAQGRDMLTEPEAKTVFSAYGIAVVAARSVGPQPLAAVDAAKALGFPVVLKARARKALKRRWAWCALSPILTTWTPGSASSCAPTSRARVWAAC